MEPDLAMTMSNALVWAAIHLFVARAMSRLKADVFDPEAALWRGRPWEREGRVYRRFRVHRWKDALPDAGRWFSWVFAKDALRLRTPADLARWRQETCRAELTHWLSLAAFPVFALWNPPGALAVMALYAAAANLPFILVQRYNRLRLSRLALKFDVSSWAVVPRPAGGSLTNAA